MMRLILAICAFVGLLLTGCSQPTTPRDTDQQQGNPKAQPEKGAKSNSNKQPGDDQAGKDAHTQTRPDSRKL